MVDSLSGVGSAGAVSSKPDPVAERREKKAEDVKTDEARESDRVEISERAQSLSQAEDKAREVRVLLEQQTDKTLSGGRVDTLA